MRMATGAASESLFFDRMIQSPSATARSPKSALPGPWYTSPTRHGRPETQTESSGARILAVPPLAPRHPPAIPNGGRGVIIPRATGINESIGVCRSRTNADDRLAPDPLGRVEGRDGVIEGRDLADVRPHSPVTRPPDDLTQLGAIGYDDEVNREAVSGPRLGRPDDGHQRPSGANQARGPPPDVAAEGIEHQIDPADVFQGVVLEVDELLRAEVERRLTVGGASGADDVGASLTCELGHHRTDCAGRAVHEDALPRLKAAVLEQPLPGGQARHPHARPHREIDVARQRREV